MVTACSVHFVSTEDSLKARSSLETKRKAIQRTKSITADHEGIVADFIINEVVGDVRS